MYNSTASRDCFPRQHLEWCSQSDFDFDSGNSIHSWACKLLTFDMSLQPNLNQLWVNFRKSTPFAPKIHLSESQNHFLHVMCSNSAFANPGSHCLVGTLLVLRNDPWLQVTVKQCSKQVVRLVRSIPPNVSPFKVVLLTKKILIINSKMLLLSLLKIWL